jgi:hypothetical protein
LDRGVSRKVHAPGVGVIDGDGTVLTSFAD